MPWQDRFLAREVFSHRPFLANPHEAGAAWDRLAERLLEDSWCQGSGTEINCMGGSLLCQIQEAHHTPQDIVQKNETKSLQKAGADEEVNEHIKLPGATSCEKQGQRITASLEFDKENQALTRKWLRHQSALEKVLIECDRMDQRQLQQAQEQDEHHHGELKEGMQHMANSVSQLADALKSQADRDAERNAQLTELLKLVTTMIQNQACN
ncbi:hypothetical protein M422DRAFT_243822 [Sphaerobolus stellatus SS14]|nr:hypothetical protein M422DRAFT_243822 [Sphaerobolus stellatus SS14]